MEENEHNDKDKLNIEYSTESPKGKKEFKFVYEGLGKTLFGILIILSIIWYCISKKTFEIAPIIYSLVGITIICGYLTIQKKF